VNDNSAQKWSFFFSLICGMCSETPDRFDPKFRTKKDKPRPISPILSSLNINERVTFASHESHMIHLNGRIQKEGEKQKVRVRVRVREMVIIPSQHLFNHFNIGKVKRFFNSNNNDTL
jgi:hypothetical protein